MQTFHIVVTVSLSLRTGLANSGNVWEPNFPWKARPGRTTIGQLLERNHDCPPPLGPSALLPTTQARLQPAGPKSAPSHPLAPEAQGPEPTPAQHAPAGSTPES